MKSIKNYIIIILIVISIFIVYPECAYAANETEKLVVNSTQELDYSIINTYNEINNTVTVTINSSSELKKDKAGSWTYNDDSLSISKEYTENTNYYTTITDIYGNSKKVNIVVNEIKKKEFKVTAEEIYDEATNTSTIKISSNIELKKDKAGSWMYSSDSLSVSKKYTENTNYNTTVHDIYGNSINVNIVIEKIQKKDFKVTAEEIYDEATNTSIIKISSNTELKKDKSGSWIYSSDSLSLSKKYTENTNYYTTVHDIYGNSINVNIVIEKIQKKDFKVTAEEIYDEATNTSIIKISSNTELKKDKSGSWMYSSDSLSLSKKYTENTNYYTTVHDIYGNSINVNIVIEKIQKKDFKVTAEEIYDEATNTSIIKISSNTELKKDKSGSWIYSSDSLSLSKKYTENTNYYTTVHDIYGNSINVNIVIEKIQKKEFKVTVEEIYDEATNTSIIKISSNTELKKDKEGSWMYSNDSLSLSKKYTENTNYYTTVHDIYGNSINVNIIVEKIQDKRLTTLTATEIYDEDANVSVIMIGSPNELKRDKDSSWSYSDDACLISKLYTANTDYYTTFNDIYGNTIQVHIVVEKIKNRELSYKVSTKYNSNKNTVTVTITTNNLLSKSKDSSWKYSDDLRSVSKEYDANTNYSTSIIDVEGHKEEVNIVVTDVKELILNTTNTYNKDTNTVTVKITSNLELEKNQDDTWIYSGDLLSMSKEYSLNGNDSIIVKDKYGKSKQVNILVNEIDKIAPKINVTYEFLNDGKIAVHLTSNEILLENKNSEAWTLSENKLTYTRIYDKNLEEDYQTSVSDIYGNETKVYIKIGITNSNLTGKDNSSLNVKYVYTSNETVCAIITSSVKFKDTKSQGGWILFNDGYSYKKEYNRNTNYNTSVENIDGVITTININVSEINDIAPVIKIEYKVMDDGKIIVYAKSNKKLLDNKLVSEWTLSEDSLTYTLIYDKNLEVNYTESFSDLHNNEVNAYIKIKIRNDSYTRK